MPTFHQSTKSCARSTASSSSDIESSVSPSDARPIPSTYQCWRVPTAGRSRTHSSSSSLVHSSGCITTPSGSVATQTRCQKGRACAETSHARTKVAHAWHVRAYDSSWRGWTCVASMERSSTTQMGRFSSGSVANTLSGMMRSFSRDTRCACRWCMSATASGNESLIRLNESFTSSSEAARHPSSAAAHIAGPIEAREWTCAGVAAAADLRAASWRGAGRAPWCRLTAPATGHSAAQAPRHRSHCAAAGSAGHVLGHENRAAADAMRGRS
eukprot:scaffold98689_cov69-Phaeocystis_antarctica.AAC.2